MANATEPTGTCSVPKRRRVAAIVVSNLLCEIVQRAHPNREPSQALGVVLLDEPIDAEPAQLNLGIEPGPTAHCELKATLRLDAVNEEAERYGVRAGQTIREALALVSNLTVLELTREQLETELQRLAEIALAFGATVAFEAPDTIWVDIGGSAHLFGGEEALAHDLLARIRAVGHVARLAISDGPRLAQGFARWKTVRSGKESVFVVDSASTVHEYGKLPNLALPIERPVATWLARLGLHTVSSLAKLPPKALSSRLGVRAQVVLELCRGNDPEPLKAFQPPPQLAEQLQFDDSIEGVQPLLFVLRGLAARLSARLQGRGLYAQTLELCLEHDRSIAKLRAVEQTTSLRYELAAPVWRENELRRVITSRLERTRLRAPTVGLTLSAVETTAALPQQLDLARGASGVGSSLARGPETLPVLLAELGADIGRKNVGVLTLNDGHAPESRCALKPVKLGKTGRAKAATTGGNALFQAELLCNQQPTRLLPQPVTLESPLKVGADLMIGRELFKIIRRQFLKRIDTSWWEKNAVSRDYLKLWLKKSLIAAPGFSGPGFSGPGGSGGQSAANYLEVLAYVDRRTGARFIQGVFD